MKKIEKMPLRAVVAALFAAALLGGALWAIAPGTRAAQDGKSPATA